MFIGRKMDKCRNSWRRDPSVGISAPDCCHRQRCGPHSGRTQRTPTAYAGSASADRTPREVVTVPGGDAQRPSLASPIARPIKVIGRARLVTSIVSVRRNREGEFQSNSIQSRPADVAGFVWPTIGRR